MSSAETLRRQWGLLQRIPRYPRKISTAELHDRISKQLDVSLRTIQRDLQARGLCLDEPDTLDGRDDWSRTVRETYSAAAEKEAEN